MRANRSSDAGFTLIEMLVALLVLSLGLLGLAALQAQSLRYNTDAYLRTQATTLAYDILDRMRANNTGAAAGAYERTAAPTGTIKNCESVACTTAELALYDCDRWYKALAARLPRPLGTVSSIDSTGNQHTITIRWTERDMEVVQTWVAVI